VYLTRNHGDYELLEPGRLVQVTELANSIEGSFYIHGLSKGHNF
jgi:hypothetical protein